MTPTLRTMAALLAFAIAGCSGPKPPPGWPSGEERPINPSQITKASK